MCSLNARTKGQSGYAPIKGKLASSVGAMIYGPQDYCPAGRVNGAGDYMPAETKEMVAFRHAADSIFMHRFWIN
jgi:hypothetical protein